MTFDENIIEKEDKMDENTYANHVKNFKLKATKIKKKIKMYTKEQVSLVDANAFRDYLKVVRIALEELTEDITNVTDVFDVNIEQARIEELDNILDEVRNEVLKNEAEVKQKVLELTSEEAANKSRSEADTRAEKSEKLKKRMSFLVNRAKEYEEELNEIDSA